MILIREDFLHYLWRFKYFAINKLQTTSNEPIHIINVGEHNFNSGPDFFSAKIKIADQLWAGNVEIHVKSSDWYLHHHEQDSNYDNVILHVVWVDDIGVYDKNNRLIPTLELNTYVSQGILDQYSLLFSKKMKWINCENLITTIDNFTVDNWLEVLYFERLEEKTNLINTFLESSSNDWEAVLFKLLVKNFGLKINGDAFLNLADSIDFKVLRKEQFKLINIEAIFFGQAGFLQEKKEDPYYQKLQIEYRYLQKKYHLEPVFNGQFQFFRLRPNNFPTIRIAQLAYLYFSHHNLFSKILEINTKDSFYKLFRIKTSSFWEQHYGFASKSVSRPKKLSKSFIDLIIINTVIPIKFMYFKHMGHFKEELILNLIKQIAPENNSILKKFESLFDKRSILPGDTYFKLSIDNALDSQALLQLKNAYCNYQLCLKCSIGNSLIQGDKL